MKKCVNCNNYIRDGDKYCRTCGTMVINNSKHLLIGIISFLLIIGIIFMILLFIASYLVNK